MQPDAWQVVLGFEVVPVPTGDVEQHLDGGVVGVNSWLDDKSTNFPADGELARDVQRARWLEQLLGHGLVLGERPEAYVDGREVFCLENHKTLGALQRMSSPGAAPANRLSRDLRLLQEKRQLGVGHFEVGRQVDVRWRRTGRHRRGTEERIRAGWRDFTCES